MAKTPKKMGRPKITIDWDKVEKLCAIMCTGEEIAAITGYSYDTLLRAISKKYKQTFAEYYKTHSSKGKASLRRAQYKLAVEGNNPTMLIWLGKQHLDQNDKMQTEHSGPNGGPIKTHKVEWDIQPVRPAGEENS